MGSPQFEIRESLESGWLRLTLLGEMDMSTASELETRLGVLQAERRSVVMDLSRLEFMDSTGLSIMTRAINASRSDGWVFVIDPDLSPQVRKLFSLTALDRFAGLNSRHPPPA
jgi:anti-sigma B factor antagonist